ncbi:MAG: hypothetical protein LBP59_08550 [Planctomycetaceae bacterium]|jgi:hypothetical protein|nr:hypothetical protein [Planctomycetaceae bacterium]
MSEVLISNAFVFALRQNAGETPAIRWSRLHFRIAQAFRLQKKVMQALKDRTRRRIAGVSPACGCTQPQMRDVYISTAFLFALRQNAGEMPAIRWSRLLFRIAVISPGILQIRRRNAAYLDK